MAFLTVSNRVLANRGSLKQETGQVSEDGTDAAHTIQTKLGRILYFQLQGLGTVSDNAADMSFNSQTDAGAEDDPGWMHIAASQLATSGSYQYLAIGDG
jgi:hypothetical protein